MISHAYSCLFPKFINFQQFCQFYTIWKVVYFLNEFQFRKFWETVKIQPRNSVVYYRFRIKLIRFFILSHLGLEWISPFLLFFYLPRSLIHFYLTLIKNNSLNLILTIFMPNFFLTIFYIHKKISLMPQSRIPLSVPFWTVLFHLKEIANIFQRSNHIQKEKCLWLSKLLIFNQLHFKTAFS